MSGLSVVRALPYHTIRNRILFYVYIFCRDNVNTQVWLSQRYTNADLKISLYIQIHIKIIPRKFSILNRKNSRVFHRVIEIAANLFDVT